MKVVAEGEFELTTDMAVRALVDSKDVIAQLSCVRQIIIGMQSSAAQQFLDYYGHQIPKEDAELVRAIMCIRGETPRELTPNGT